MLCHRLRRGGVVYEFAYRTHVSAAANNVVIPGDVDDRDLLVFINFRSVTTGTVSLVTPAGFTSVGSEANSYAPANTNRIAVSMKIADITDQGQTVTGMSSGSGTVVNHCILLVLRANRRISSLNSGLLGTSVLGAWSNPGMGGSLIPTSSRTPPLVAIGMWRQDTPTGQSLDVTPDQTITQGTVTIRTKFYNQSPANVSIGTTGDGGDNNFGGGFSIGVS